MTVSFPRLAAAALAMLITTGCTHQFQWPRDPTRSARSNDYTKFRAEDPHSILVVPAVNRSVDVTAPDYFLSSISIPLAERGYYVFPVNLVKQVMADDGLSDSDMVHEQEPQRLADLFGADSVMYISIERWDARYVVLSTAVTVSLNYVLKSGRSGETLWSSRQTVQYAPNNNDSGGGLAGLIAQAIVAAIQKAAPDYMPLAQQANNQALYAAGSGLPAGPYHGLYGQDKDTY
ncbi:GNA1162 family protein [Bordetella sp. LUAb4]|uniref:DUF799 domain-containing protein n=1 Tax=Bordetella sp. LUAb4 TaxID=2843195 RepID=UPI001E36EEC0|nr:GNA1162 family protein [Bordetella sp. LUAb4]